jgi:PAS fold
LTEGFDLAALSRAEVSFFHRMKYNIYTQYQQDVIIGVNTDLLYIFVYLEFILTYIPSNKFVLGLAAFGRTYALKDPNNCATQGCPFSNGRIFTMNRTAYKVFGWSESKFIGSNISMIVKKDHDTMHDQYVKQYQETVERFIAHNQCSDLDETFVLAQRVKVSHNILYQDTKRAIIRNTLQVNICFVINSDVGSNKFEIQDCQTKQMLKEFFTQRKRFFEIRGAVMESKLSDAFKECVGCILFIQLTVLNKGLRRKALKGERSVYCYNIVTSYLRYAYQRALHKGIYDIGIKRAVQQLIFQRFHDHVERTE